MKIKILRTGQRPLSFEGERLAGSSSHHHAGKERNRWHEIEVYKSASGKFACAVSYHTQWQGEATHDDALVFDSLDEVATLLEEYIFPNIASIGFPASPQFGERQAKLLADLEESFRHAASETLQQLGCSESL